MESSQRNTSVSFEISRTESTPLASFVTTLVYVEASIPNPHIHQWVSPSRLEDHLWFPERVLNCIPPSWLHAFYLPIQHIINHKSIAGCHLETVYFALPQKFTLDFSIACGFPSEQIYSRIPLPNLRRLNHPALPFPVVSNTVQDLMGTISILTLVLIP